MDCVCGFVFREKRAFKVKFVFCIVYLILHAYTPVLGIDVNRYCMDFAREFYTKRNKMCASIWNQPQKFSGKPNQVHTLSSQSVRIYDLSHPCPSGFFCWYWGSRSDHGEYWKNITMIRRLTVLTIEPHRNTADSVHISCLLVSSHDDFIKWKHFPRYLPFVRGIHRSPVNSPHKGQWRGALMFSLICAWKNCWATNRDQKIIFI